MSGSAILIGVLADPEYTEFRLIARRFRSQLAAAESLHRIEPASVREEVEAAGFVLDAESTMLANKDDPHSIKVFDPSIKGQTDRFVYRFLKI